MATNITYVYELPVKDRRQLCRILDADNRWEELGESMGYDITTITLIGRKIYCDKSPTWELLEKFSEKTNGKVEDLFKLLAEIGHQRAMSVLQPYVEEEFHYLLRNDSAYTKAFKNYLKKEDIPRPSLSQHPITLTNRLPQSSHASSSTLKHITETQKEKENFTATQSQLGKDLEKKYQSFSSILLQSSVNVLQAVPKAAARKKSPNLSQFKKNTYFKKESILDNHLSDKLKKGRKLSLQEMVNNGKQLNKHPHLPSGANCNSQDDSLPDITHIPYSEICKATDNFNDARVLGRGGFGTVYKGEWIGTSVAIKKLTPRKISNSPSQHHVSLKQSLNELNILKCCRFDHILPLYAVSLDGAHPCLIYRLMVNGSLEDRLLCKNKTTPLTWLQRSHIAECTSKGLNYLHTTYGKPLVHGDIKSANILLDSNMDARIGDFGLTREGPGCLKTHVTVTSLIGTECYLPPEYLRHKHLSPQVDIYSYGIVLLEIATGLRPFHPKREAKRLVDYVRLCDESGRLDSLQDRKAGEEYTLWFRELIEIGKVCSSSEKKKRLPMQEVLGRFEKIKTEISMVDRIRRLSIDNENPLKNMKSNPEIKLTPFQMQLAYDQQKNGVNAASENNKMLSIPPENAASIAIPLVIDQMEDVSPCSKESESSFKSLDRRDSYVSSDSSSFSENESYMSSKLTESGGASPECNTRVLPLPLLSVLQMQVSQSEDFPASQNSACTNENNTGS